MPEKKPNLPQQYNFAYRVLWEQLYAGQRYFITGTDLAKAKELIDNNPQLQVSDVAKHFIRYALDDYWLKRHLPAYGLWGHFNDYMPTPHRQKTTGPTLIACSGCGTIHAVEDACPLPADAIAGPIPALRQILDTLVNAFQEKGAKHELQGKVRPRHDRGDQ